MSEPRRPLDLLVDAFHRPSSGPGRAVGAVVWASILASVVVLGLDLRAPADWAGRSALAWVDRGLLALFAVEYVAWRSHRDECPVPEPGVRALR